MAFDPNAKEYQGGARTEWIKEAGKYVFAAVGFERFISSAKKTPMLGIRMVCIKGPQKGKVFVPEFAMTQKAMWKFAEFCRAIGQTTPFDPDDNEQLGEVLVKGFVSCELAPEVYNGKSRLKAGDFEPWSGELDPDVESEDKDDEGEPKGVIAKAEKGHQTYMAWRAKPGNSREEQAAERAKNGGGQRSGGGGGSHASDEHVDDVPF